VRIYTSFDPAQSCALGCVGIAGVDPNKLTAHLWDQHRIIVTPIVHDEFQGIRVTPNVYTTLGEIDEFCVAMEKVVQKGIGS
jgi:selenocysteine lyase/cysteine desulfurase